MTRAAKTKDAGAPGGGPPARGSRKPDGEHRQDRKQVSRLHAGTPFSETSQAPQETATNRLPARGASLSQQIWGFNVTVRGPAWRRWTTAYPLPHWGSVRGQAEAWPSVGGVWASPSWSPV